MQNVKSKNILLFILFTTAPTAWAQKSKTNGGLFSSDVAEHKAQAPITYRADEMTAYRNNEKDGKDASIDLKGHVTFTQDATTLTADTVKIFFKKTGEQGSQTPHNVIASGHVRIVKNSSVDSLDIHAKSEQVEYDVPAKKMILTGKPEVWRGSEKLTGQHIEIDLITGEVHIQGARGVVEP